MHEKLKYIIAYSYTENLGYNSVKVYFTDWTQIVTQM